MKTKWWKSPQMFLVYGAVGAIAGGIISLHILEFAMDLAVRILHAQDGLHEATSGVTGGIMEGIILIFHSITLGATTGCVLVHMWGIYRHIAAVGAISSGCLLAAVTAYIGVPYASNYGNEVALAVFGFPFIWSLLLIFFGGILAVISRHD